MAKTSHANVDKAMAWARSVLKGKFPACRYIHQAIQRHFDDVVASRSKSFPYKFDPKKAEKKLRLMQLLPQLHCPLVCHSQCVQQGGVNGPAKLQLLHISATRTRRLQCALQLLLHPL